MPVFSRRFIQRMLDENASFLSEEQLLNHVDKLNREDLQALDTEWEVAVLNAFSKIGAVQHEVDLGGTSRLDLLFSPSADESDRIAAEFADVSIELAPTGNIYA